MALRERIVEYRDGNVTCKGWYCYDDGFAQPQPGVLICHAAMGRDEFVERKGRRLAWHGYACFGLDMYGNNRRGTTREENARLMQPFVDDRTLLVRRVRAGLDALRTQPEVDARRIAAIGFCFGGMCALDLARSGADVRGVVSFHGLLKPPPQPLNATIKAKILVLHGNDDPLSPTADVVALTEELSKAQADWQIHLYGGTMHSFTFPTANNPAIGTVYKEEADRRSWHTLMNFLEETLK
jgi:dienelactone hydrolase